jgi:threonine dehydrogenase-like Zn-dependent dehydrogenase
MRALTWDGREARVAERPVPEIGHGDALVRVQLAGICNTDLEITRGYLGFRGTLGHEFVGMVEAGPDEWRGRRVVGEINFACGACSSCRTGMQRHCATRSVMGIVGADGALAELLRVPAANLHAVPDAVSDEQAVFAEPLAAAFEVLEQVHVCAETRAAVLGDGKLGLLVAQVLHQAGARVIAVGRHPEKLAILAARGIETREIGSWDAASARADLVVEATGTLAGFAVAIAATRPRGTLVLKSTVASTGGSVDPALLAHIVIHEITVVGSRCGSFPPALRALASGSVDVGPLVSRAFPLADAADALRHAAEPGVLKVIVAPAVRGHGAATRPEQNPA